jgi:FKBP-type peptidyl-prolyl cis-trans isomerase FklB
LAASTGVTPANHGRLPALPISSIAIGPNMPTIGSHKDPGIFVPFFSSNSRKDLFQMSRRTQSLSLIAALSLLLAHHSASWAQGGLPQGQPGQTPASPAVGGPVDDATYKQQVSYMLGQNVGRDLLQNQVDCNLESFIAGVTDALRGAPPKWSEAELQTCRARFEQEMRQKMMGRMQQAAEKNKQEEAAFLAKNAQAEGVQTTPSGLQYKVLKQGTGATPALTDGVRCHYRGTLLDGTEFDSSYGGEPAEFPVDQVIPGWTEALQKMKVGDKWQLFVPADLAYGATPPGPPIQPNSLLIFEVELLGINGN